VYPAAVGAVKKDISMGYGGSDCGRDVKIDAVTISSSSLV